MTASSPAPIVQEPIPLWPPGSMHGQDREEGAPRLTPFLPVVPPRDAIVVCPGGGYRNLAPHEGEPVARWLTGLGLAAFVLSYRVAPHRHPAPLLDAQRALRLVRCLAGRWGLTTPRVGILGFSAGGHLAATAGTQFDRGDPLAADPVERHSCRPDLLILGYPVITFGEHRHEGSLANLLGADAPHELRRAFSAEERVTAATPPAFLWHTADDASVPVENSLLFALALRRHDVPFALHIYPHGRHGLGLAADDPVVGSWTTLCARWLAGQGYGASGRPVP